MLTLQQALELTPWRLLLFIGRQRGLSLSSSISKADLIDRLADHLSSPDNLETTLASLAGEEQQALFSLLTAGGSIPLRYLQSFYGTLRSPRQLPSHYPARTVPAASASQTPPLSPLERLRALGLIFYPRSSTEVFIPTDLMPFIEAAKKRRDGDTGRRGREDTGTRGGEDTRCQDTERLADATSSPQIISSSPRLTSPRLASPVDLLCHDLTCLLALLQREDITPLHGRWLPASFLADWSQNCVVAPALPNARSELQTGRRRFLHYLAENAGWLPSTLNVLTFNV